MITTENRSPSRTSLNSSSPTRTSLSNRLSAFGAKISRTLSGAESTLYGDKDSVSTVVGPVRSPERSLSRGREAFSTGRGGVGNFRPTSQSRTRPDTGPDDFSNSRGREPLVNPSNIYSTGRGGAGNIRSPSRPNGNINVPSPVDITEQEIIRNHIANSQEIPHSTGRGGIGNINARSRSRGPAAATTPATPVIHSTGRGGVGNIVSGGGGGVTIIDEEERKKYADATPTAPYRSTGRGGFANLTSTNEPDVEPVIHTPGEFGSTGRGGVGNIIHQK